MKTFSFKKKKVTEIVFYLFFFMDEMFNFVCDE